MPSPPSAAARCRYFIRNVYCSVLRFFFYRLIFSPSLPNAYGHRGAFPLHGLDLTQGPTSSKSLLAFAAESKALAEPAGPGDGAGRWGHPWEPTAPLAFAAEGIAAGLPGCGQA